MSENEQENENRETVADIVAEMRKESKKVRTVIRPDGYGDYEKITLESNPYLKNVADRIEAAWKRERAKVEADALTVGGIVEAARTAEKSSAVGNAAAMREALLEARRFVWTSAHRTDRDLLVTDDEKRGPYVLSPKDTLAKIDAALSSPPRNCDLNLSAKSLWDKFEDYMHDCGLPFYSEPSGEDTFEWLIAPATKKGEGDGR